jgi:curved DNA-binding protein CbpA
MIAINEAWAALSTPERRATYDRERAARSADAGVRAEPAPDRRSRPPGDGVDPVADALRTAAGAKGPETVSGDWTTGRSTVGGGYDPATMRTTEGFGAAGPPPGSPSGSKVTFGRYAGWTVGEIGRSDLDYLEWLERSPIGRQYREEIDGLLRHAGRRRSGTADDGPRRGLFRRR